MIKHINVIEVNQPIGTFYIGKIPAHDLIKISQTIRRSNSADGVQRDLKEARVNSIAQYCNDPDATFPTPIILSVKTTATEKLSKDANNCLSDYVFEYDDANKFAEILDGQHRIEGIERNKSFVYDLVVVIMFDLTKEEQAYVFSTINSNQVKVDKSTIYDLFGLFETRSPYKTCHEIARIMNSDIESPFHNRLKMLGKKTEASQTLAQGAFVTYLVELISKDPKEDAILIKKNAALEDDLKFPLRRYFINNKDEIILKILYNYFNAVSEVFPNEWVNSEKYILLKTTGFAALMTALKAFFKVGFQEKKLTQEFFKNQLDKSKITLSKKHMQLTSEYFPSNSAGVNKMSQVLTEHLSSQGNI
ncbi:MAG: hypothetical protein C0413_01875 [Clostridiales bacterium]|nr:hypothetical protein [Clostridiales bacterium]